MGSERLQQRAWDRSQKMGGWVTPGLAGSS
jgi:hypothetical protein